MRNTQKPSNGGDTAIRVVKRRPAPTGDPTPSWNPDDDKIAADLITDAAIKDKLKFFYTSWRMYEGGVWRSQDVSEVRRYIRQQLRHFRQFGTRVNQNRIKSLSQMLEDDLYIPDRRILEVQEEQQKYVNLRNGMFNLQTMQFEPDHRPELLFTTQLDFDYDPDATCPVFRDYLNSSLVLPNTTTPDRTLIILLLEALGYSMTARTDMKASFWLVGKKDSGKSTFVALLKSLMGSLHGTIDLNQLDTNRFLLSSVVGKRVISFTESDSNAVLPDSLYKTLVGGVDEVYADVKNRDAICFRPECKVWWAMNDGQLPRVADRSGATMKRIIIIPFNRTIPEKDRIPNLEERLRAERSGIFNWMVVYLKRLNNGGTFEYCEQSENYKREYIMENDTEATYIEERAEKNPKYKISSNELHHDYKSWCEEHGFKPKNYNQVNKEWRRLGFEYKRSDGSWWHGLRLKGAEPIKF